MFRRRVTAAAVTSAVGGSGSSLLFVQPPLLASALCFASSSSSSSSSSKSTPPPPPPSAPRRSPVVQIEQQAAMGETAALDTTAQHAAAAHSKDGTGGASEQNPHVASFLNQFHYQGAELGLKLAPPDMAVELLEYQKEGVGWMARREHFYSGGIMADFLGMGKTVQMLALCLARQTTAASNSAQVTRAIEQQQAQVDRIGFAHGEPFRIQTVIQQLLQIPAVVNCSKITQPARNLLDLKAEVERVVAQHGTVPEKQSLAELRAVAKEMDKWLSFVGKYYESWEKRARFFLAQREDPSSGAADALNGGSSNNLLETPELRTLVIVPASLMFQWKHEIDNKIDSKRGIRTMLYHGEKVRSKDASVADLEMHDFVITTYESVVRGALPAFSRDAHRGRRSSSGSIGGVGRRAGMSALLGGGGGGGGSGGGASMLGGPGGAAGAMEADSHHGHGHGHESMRAAMFNRAAASPIFRVRWKRIILDEAHYVRNEHTSRFRAIRQLLGLKRWAVTATPLHNSIADLQTLLTFVGQPKLPLFDANETMLLKDPVMQRAIARSLQPAFLRRTPVMTRGGVTMTLVKLPTKDDIVVRGELSAEEVAAYNTALTTKQKAISQVRDRSSFMHVFAMMTLLRQACCHPWMTEGKASTVQICFTCKLETMSSITTRCGHSFCAECLHSAFRTYGIDLEHNNASSSSQQAGGDAAVVRLPCPACAVPIPLSIFASAPKRSSAENIEMLKKKPWRSSTKLDMLLDALKHIMQKHPGDKVVVFAQFTTLLDIVSIALEKLMKDVQYVRIDGSLPLKERNGLINAFTEDARVKVLLASKMAMGVGLNLTAANHVIVLDPWWNPRVEEQAVHRCHRIGQTKHVHVQRFVMNDTIEQYCYEISSKKKDFGDAVLRAATAEGDDDASEYASPAKQVADMVSKHLKPIGAGGAGSTTTTTAAMTPRVGNPVEKQYNAHL